MLSCHHSHFIKCDHLICKDSLSSLASLQQDRMHQKKLILKCMFTYSVCNSILLTDICNWSFCCDLVVQKSFYSFPHQQKILNVEVSNCRKSFLFVCFFIAIPHQPQIREFCPISLKLFVNFWCIIYYFQAQDQKYLTLIITRLELSSASQNVAESYSWASFREKLDVYMAEYNLVSDSF